MQKRLVVVADTQAPFHLPQAVALARAFIKDYKPDTLVFNGDMIDFVTMSKFLRSTASGPHTAAEELSICENEVILPLCEVAPKARKIWVEGNHEFRLTRYIQACAPSLQGLINMDDVLGCKRNKIEYIASKAGNGVFRLTDHLTIMHGTATGLNPAKAQYEQWGASLVMGHTHKESTWRKKHGCGRDDVAMSSGCLCKDPDWRDIDNYTRGFIFGWYDDETGEFSLDHARISGKDHTTLYAPWNTYEATFARGAWIARTRDRARKG